MHARLKSIALGMAVSVVGAAMAPRLAVAADLPAKRPNVILILADDLGYADVGAQGISKDVRTPNIDSIARDGARFTNAYVSCPVCSPTRAGLMTGRYQQRFGHEFNPGPSPAGNFGLPKDQVTLADAFKSAGYKTGLIGKWHLGPTAGLQPLDRGFDEFFGFLGGAHPYVNNERPAANANAIMRGRTPVGEEAYLTDAIAREGAAFIDRHKAEPFFEYVAFNEVHTPQEATKKYLDRFPNETDAKRRQMLAKLSAADDAVGQILAKLREHKLEDNTLVFFLSDNGGPTQGNGSRNTPLSGYKGQVYEGGIRVPFFVKWPGQVPKGKIFDQPIIALDIFPTALAAIGGGPKTAVDGKNLLPLLKGETNDRPHESLFWRFGTQWAMRSGDLKFVHTIDGDEKLFDLAADAGEHTDLAATRPADFKRLRTEFATWNSELIAPLWSDGRGERRAARRRNRLEPAATTAPSTQPADDND